MCLARRSKVSSEAATLSAQKEKRELENIAEFVLLILKVPDVCIPFRRVATEVIMFLSIHLSHQ